MTKGLIINIDIWDLIEELEEKQSKALLSDLADYHRGIPVTEEDKDVLSVLRQIMNDNHRFDPSKPAFNERREERSKEEKREERKKDRKSARARAYMQDGQEDSDEWARKTWLKEYNQRHAAGGKG